MPGSAGIQRKLDAALAAVDADLPEDLRAQMAAGVPDEVREAEKREALAADPLPAGRAGRSCGR